QPYQNTRLAHALQQFERRQPPDHVAEFVASQQAFLSQENQAKNKRERKPRIGEDAQGNVKRKRGPVRRRRRKPVGRGQMRSEKEHQDKGHYEGSDRSLPVIQLSTQIGQRQKPAKERHGSVQFMVRNRVQTAGPLQKRKIMR